MSEDIKQENSSIPWHSLSGEEALSRADSDRQGLSRKEAEKRLAENGPNRLREEERRYWWQRLLDQFKSLFIIILLIASGVSAAIGHWVDAGAIFAVVLINAAIAYVQEGKAERALEGIKKMLSPEATVIREGERKTISAEEVVYGDIVAIGSGDRIPADVRLLNARQFRTQEAVLTGESEPVEKSTEAVKEETDLAERQPMAYAGTLAVHGSAEGVVVATATGTEIGQISKMISEVKQVRSPLLRQLDRFSKVLAGAIVLVALAMGLFGVVVHDQSFREMFMASVAMAVAAIPQGLPAIVTITLAFGVRAMAGRNAIIRRLPAVETLGSISTIFSDKTGTLTRNEMTATVLATANMDIEISGVGFRPEGDFTRSQNEQNDTSNGHSEKLNPQKIESLEAMLVSGALCNESALISDDDSWKIDGDPTEGALVVAAAKAGIDVKALRQAHRRLDIIPFESERKYMATLNEKTDGDERLIHVKGAPDVILEMCSQVRGQGRSEELDREYWENRILELSSRGLRVLAVARKQGGQGDEINEENVDTDLVLLGLVGIMDPPRQGVDRAIDKCRSAGIDVKMVTGDHGLTAAAIGKEVGLSHTDKPMSGNEIEDCSEDELKKRIRETSIFARALPEHKLKLVTAIQSDGEVCAMTGDGVNDAPALKRADVGVAMGIQGTEASKEASEMVLADDNFATIVSAIEEGRRVYANIRKTIAFLLPTNGAESLAILIAVLANTALPITPVQILWVNMVTAVTLGLALAFEAADEDIMQQRPRDPDAPILDLFLIWRVMFVSCLLVAPVYGVFIWLQSNPDVPIEVARSAAVNMLVAGEIVYLLSIRLPVSSSLSVRGIFGSRPALIAIGLVVIFQLLWTYTAPMQLLFSSAGVDAFQWSAIVLTAVLVFLVIEIEKFGWRIIKRRKGQEWP